MSDRKREREREAGCIPKIDRHLFLLVTLECKFMHWRKILSGKHFLMHFEKNK